jgi:hypothetical protein
MIHVREATVMKDKPIVGAAKVIVSTAIVVPVALVGIALLALLIGVLALPFTSSIPSALLAGATIAYLVRRDKRKQAAYIAQARAEAQRQAEHCAWAEAERRRLGL